MSKIFPVFDFLYIFQLFEYQIWPYLKWFIKYPFKRNLQKKYNLEFTKKALALLLLCLILILKDAVFLSSITINNFYLTPIFFVLLMQISPLYLIILRIILFPLELYQKNKILNQAREKLKKQDKLKVIGITGSWAKTSTKEILYTLLWKKYRVVKTPKSFNTLLGVAETILSDVKENTQILIAEIGAYKKGEINQIAQLVKPEIGIITAVGLQHLERFGSLENIANAKLELVESLSSESIAILNGNNKLLLNLSKKTRCKIFYFGKNRVSDYFVSDIYVNSTDTRFLMHTPKGEIRIVIPLMGKHHIENFLAASAAAINLGLSLKEIQERAKLLLSTPHRLEIKKMGNITIIDNSYNTNPQSSKESFKLLKDFPGEQKILITPGLIELGKESEKENIEFAKNAAKVADEIIIIGENAKEFLLKGLKGVNFSNDRIHLVTSFNDSMDLLGKFAKPNAIILIENDLPDQYF